MALHWHTDRAPSVKSDSATYGLSRLGWPLGPWGLCHIASQTPYCPMWWSFRSWGPLSYPQSACPTQLALEQHQISANCWISFTTQSKDLILVFLGNSENYVNESFRDLKSLCMDSQLNLKLHVGVGEWRLHPNFPQVAYSRLTTMVQEPWQNLACLEQTMWHFLLP